MNEPWYSLSWFSPERWQAFQFDHRLVLYGILGFTLLFFVRQWLHRRARQQLSLSLGARPDPGRLGTVWLWGRYLLPLSFLLGISCVLIALARPQVVRERRQEQSLGIDIMLAFDVSSSMAETDLRPNRLAAARQVAVDFVGNRKNDRIGLVAFAGEAFSVCPLTTDYALLRQYLSELKLGLIETAGTAIGDALARCINRMRQVEATGPEGEEKQASKVIILLSDGENTAGRLDPVMAARLAKAYGIRIYTIAIGRVPSAGVPADSTQTRFAVDEGVLKTIAQVGSGSFYRAADGNQLTQVFAEINRLEKAPVRTTVYQDVQDFYRVYLYWAIVFFLIALFLKSTVFGNILED